MTTSQGASHHGRPPSPFRQPKAVWAVAFACVVSFMGLGLVDPILPALSKQLHATPSSVELLTRAEQQAEAAEEAAGLPDDGPEPQILAPGGAEIPG